jgi:hypothetical protein
LAAVGHGAQLDQPNREPPAVSLAANDVNGSHVVWSENEHSAVYTLESQKSQSGITQLNLRTPTESVAPRLAM